jgi:LPPG:FO 2-phospho-L-lactate transferase
MGELGMDVSAVAVANRYADLLDGSVVDHADASCVQELAIPVSVTRTLMQTADDQDALARHALARADASARAAA